MRRVFATSAGPLLALCIVLGATGCLESVDPTNLHSAREYKVADKGWSPPRVMTGYIPGHKDTVRLTYANPIARAYPHWGRYPEGSVLVKEIYHKKSDGSPGDLNYIAIMRKMKDPPDGVPSQGGWVFTMSYDPEDVAAGKSEETWDGCWKSCHMQGSWDGAWDDYGD